MTTTRTVTSVVVSDRSRPWLELGGLLVLAALLRLPALATRGTWDSDQGHDMLVLRSLVRDGIVPLLGPPTSIGDVHHGALYYYLLAPAAALTGGDSPLAVVFLIALAGIAAVGVTWWLARDIGGPVAGFVAGLAMAVSASAVDESTFIWNPNLIALSSAIALAGAWRAWTTGRPRWWLLAGLGTAVTMQCHVLGVTLLPIVGVLVVADARSRPTRGERRAVWRAALGGVAIIVASFIPLAIHELTNDFSEVNAALDYLRSGGDPVTLSPVVRLLVIAVRVVSWPLTGLITDGAIPALLATAAMVALTVWLVRSGRRRERQAAVWLGLGLVWTAGFLTFASPSLATVIPGLPNDHYHAFADPMVFVLLGLGIGALWRRVPVTRIGGVAPGRVVAVVAMLTLVAWNVVTLPPLEHPDGGFPAAEQAADRILASTDGQPIVLRSLPGFKSTESYAYPLIRAGATVDIGLPPPRGTATLPPSTAASVGVSPGSVLVVVCDALFEPAMGVACGGPAEDTIAPPEQFGPPIDRFEAAPGRTISIYRAGG